MHTGTPRGTRVLVVVPAYNEAAAIAGVVADVRRNAPFADLLVVDDGSRDETAATARAAGAMVAKLPFNLGVGGAMRTGFRYAARNGYDAVVQVDGDGQHDAAYIPVLLDGLATSDVVIGARFAGSGDYVVRGPRQWAMQVLARVMTWILGVRLNDSTSGFRAAGPAAIRVYAQHYPAEYLGDTLETLVIAHKAGLTVSQVPVAMLPRLGGHPSRGILGSTIDLARAFVVVVLGLVRDWSLAPDGAQ
ncbi:glycosyl transferase family 2 [Phycicoccus sp. Root563]|nr:glycosyl transferase family 2 [Phycicoccus sp. Root563]